jgi:hypothetical protein
MKRSSGRYQPIVRAKKLVFKNQLKYEKARKSDYQVSKSRSVELVQFRKWIELQIAIGRSLSFTKKMAVFSQQ